MPPAYGYGNFVRKLDSINKAAERQVELARSVIIAPARGNLTYTGDIPGVDFANVVMKPRIPDFLYRPLYGRPRSINIPEIRRMADTPTAGMCIKTICDEVSSIPWQIRMEDPDAPANEAAISEVTERFDNPNRNKESFKFIIKNVIRDILCVDAGVVCKIFDRASYENANPSNRLLPVGRRKMLEFYARDGGSFTSNPDEYGILPDQCAYYQYNFYQMSMPVPFAKDELIYMMANPRTNNIYGVSPLEMCYDVVRYSVYGITAGIDHFTRNEIPKGVLSIIDANLEHIKEFQARLEDKVTIQDPVTQEMRWVSSKVPIVNQDVKFTPLQITPETIQLLETQQWYIKLVFACFGVTPSELGFTEDSNRATDIVQSEVFRRKAIAPMVDLIEYYINRELLPEFGFEELYFEFEREDIQTKLREQKLWDSWLKSGQRTINEWRAEYGDLDPVSWGDEPYSGSKFGGGFLEQTNFGVRPESETGESEYEEK